MTVDSIKRDYGVFIIEALGSQDLVEGEYLQEILELAKVFVEVRQVSCRSDFKKAIDDFDFFNFRYLHISCHGIKDQIGFSLVNEDLSLEDLHTIIQGKMQNRRISLSICYGGRDEIATAFIKNGAYSVIGHPDAVDQHRAVIFWASFYLLMNDESKWKMKREHILEFLKSHTRILGIPIHYYSFIKANWKDKFRRVTIDSCGIAKGQVLRFK